MVEHNFSGSIRFRYTLAIIVIALLVTGSYISIQKVISEQRNYSKIIHLASQQSGSANRIAYFSSLMASTRDESDFSTAKFQIGFDITKMENAHRLLLEGSSEHNVPLITNEELEYIYYDKMVGLDQALRRFLGYAQQVHDTPMEALSIDAYAYVYLTTYGPHVLEPMFDAAVEEYEKIGKDAIVEIEKLETFIWIITLLLLALEVVFIFRPLEKGIKSAFLSLHQSVDQLNETQHRLLSAQKIANIGDWEWHATEKKLIVSEQTKRILGLDSDFHFDSPSTVLQYVHEHDLGPLKSMIDRAVLNAESEMMEHRIVLPNGEEKRVLHQVSRSRATTEMNPVISGVVQDITELQQLSSRLRQLSGQIPGFIFQYLMRSTENYFLFASDGIEAILGVTHSEACENHFSILSIIAESDYARINEKLRDSHNLKTHLEFQVHTTHRKLIWVEFTATAEKSLDGSLIWHGYMAEITDRKTIEENLVLASSVFDHAHDAIMITDPEHNIVEVNQAFSRITGYERSEIIGLSASVLDSHQKRTIINDEIFDHVLKHGFWSGEIWSQRKNGDAFAELLTVSAVFDSSGSLKNFISLIYDITEQKEYQKKLELIAHYDALTHLPNRVMIADRLNQAMLKSQRENKNIAVAYLDLDGFKEVNDTYGHDIGDKLLIQLSKRMKNVLRDTDTIGRLGGDEFVIVLGSINQSEHGDHSIGRLLDAASRPINIDQKNIQVSASIGVTHYPQDEAVDADQLLRQADQAMYHAKLSGKNQCFLFDAEKDLDTRDKAENFKQIQKGLYQDEFLLYYQPKVNMCTGQIIGAEALIRWNHRQRGLLSPGQFLPSIEGRPFEFELGVWVMTEAISQMHRWYQNGVKVPVSINVSAQVLEHDQFIETLSSILQRYPDLPRDKLILEVLETSALDDIESVSEIMRQCQQMGVLFSLDDFGTGYSSLTYLKRLPISQIKIDQSFVKNMLENPEDQAILKGIVNIASVFQLETIVEGVETVELGETLIELGCQFAQGYCIAKPMPASEVSEWCATWRPSKFWSKQYHLNLDNDTPRVLN